MLPIEPLASEFMRALRGPRSQVAFSRRLGFRSNVAATWEAGRRWPTGATVLAAAARTGIDVREALRRFYGVQAQFLDDTDPTRPEGVAALLRDLRRERGHQEIADACGASRYQVSRWLSGVSQPRLPDLLRLVNAMTGRVLDFVALFVDPAGLPSVADRWAQLEATRSLFWRMPHAQLVLLALDLEAYRNLAEHDDTWLAERLQLPLYQVAGAVERLAATGQIRKEHGRWTPAEVHTVDTRRHPQAVGGLKQWWAEQAMARLAHPDGSWSYNAFTVSEADRARIVELYRSTFRAMRAIVAQSTPAERLVVLHQVVLPLDEP